jgi:glycosidase
LPIHAQDARAGYSTASPSTFRLPIHPEYARFNVRSQQQDPHSTWHVYRRCIELRSRDRVVREGQYEPVEVGDDNIFAFARTYKGQREDAILTLVNFADAPRQVELGSASNAGRIVISSSRVQREGGLTDGTIDLAPKEAIAIRTF